MASTFLGGKNAVFILPDSFIFETEAAKQNLQHSKKDNLWRVCGGDVKLEISKWPQRKAKQNV